MSDATPPPAPTTPNEQGSVLAIIGLVLGYVGILAWIILAVVMVITLATGMYFFTAVQ
jgi:hypothetical protein